MSTQDCCLKHCKKYNTFPARILFPGYNLRLKKVQLTAGIYAAKASRHLPGHLCERFYDPGNKHVFIPGVSIRFTQILRSRGFDAYMPAVLSSKCTFWVNALSVSGQSPQQNLPGTRHVLRRPHNCPIPSGAERGTTFHGVPLLIFLLP